MTFADRGIVAPPGFTTPVFTLRPLRASDAALDHDAVMASREFLRRWEQSTWPEDDFTVEANRDDVARAEARHAAGEAFTFTVMNPDETCCLGCVYVFPTMHGWLSDAEVVELDGHAWEACGAAFLFWVRTSMAKEGMDRVLLDALREWFVRAWPVQDPVALTNELVDEQVAMIEGSGMQRRFELRKPMDKAVYVAYA